MKQRAKNEGNAKNIAKHGNITAHYEYNVNEVVITIKR